MKFPVLDEPEEALEVPERPGARFNPASHKQVAKLLFEDLELPILGRTDSGAPSTREEFLIQLKDMHDVVPLLLRHRAFSKIKGTYVDGKDTSDRARKKALRAVVDDDGRARMNTFVHGTETFRFVTRKPFPYLTWPKTEQGMPSVRALIVPDDGYTFVEQDFVQQEFVIQAIAAGQWDMVERILDNNEDAHEIVAHELYGERKDNYLYPGPDPSEGYMDDGLVWLNRDARAAYKKIRNMAKATNFMILYRGGARKLARMALGCRCVRTRDMCEHEARAVRYIGDYYEKFDAIKWWQYNTIQRLKETGYTYDLFGARRYLPGIWDRDFFVQLEAERQGCNTPVQASGAHVMIRAFLKLCARFRGKLPLRAPFPGRVVFSVHDQLIAQVRDDVVEEGAYHVRVCMEAPYAELVGRSLRTEGIQTKRWGG